MTFTINPDRLEGLASDMDLLASHFEDVAQRRVGYQGLADAPAVDDGLREFFGKWTDGMERLHRQIDDLAKHLHSAAAGYEEADRQAEQAARSGT